MAAKALNKMTGTEIETTKGSEIVITTETITRTDLYIMGEGWNIEGMTMIVVTEDTEEIVVTGLTTTGEAEGIIMIDGTITTVNAFKRGGEELKITLQEIRIILRYLHAATFKFHAKN